MCFSLSHNVEGYYMKKANKKSIIFSIIGLLFVFFTIFVAWFYKAEIENYAATGYFGVFIACVAATSTILLPAPGILVVIQYSQLLNPFLVVLLGGFGTALGELIGYLLGRSGNEITNVNTENKIFSWFIKKPMLMVFVFSLIPFPVFDIVGVFSGITKQNPIKFFFACLLGKIIKMSFYVVLFHYAKDFLSDLI